MIAVMRGSCAAEAQAHGAVWMLWWNDYLMGVYATESSCREDLDDAQRAAISIHGAQGGTFRISQEQIRPSSRRLTAARLALLRDRALADLIEEFGLVRVPAVDQTAGGAAPLHVRLGHVSGAPGFQFDAERQLAPGLAIALNALRSAGWDDVSIALWFASPQGAANGRVPAAVLRHDPILVINAAYSTAAG